MKECKYAKTLAKIQVIAIFFKQDMRLMFFCYPNLYRFVKNTVWKRRVLAVCFSLNYEELGSNMTAGNQQKHQLLSFATKA